MSRAQQRLLLAALALVLVQGLARVAIIPLWRHYDEPAHYEYLSFLREHGRLPHPGDVDPAIMRQIAATDANIGLCEDLARPSAPESCVRAGNAFIQPPGYYLLQAAVQAAAGPRTVAGQVRLARLVSVALGVGIAWLAFLVARVVRPADTRLALAAAALLGTVPGYVDLTSAFNNDVGAVAGFSLFVFAAVHLIRGGVRFMPQLAVAAAAALCVEVKSTAAIAVPLAAAALWLAAWPRMKPWLRWAGPALVLIVGTILVVDPDWPAHWLSNASFPAVRRVRTEAPWGRYAFSVRADGKHAPVLWQAVSPKDRPALHDGVATLGAWVRSPDGARPVALPILSAGRDFLAGPTVAATPAWTFHSYAVAVAPEAGDVVVYIPEAPSGVAQYDGILLVPGAGPSDSVPRFDDASAVSGTWGSGRFENLLVNASAERGWPVLRLGVDRRVPGGGLNGRLASLYEVRRTWPVYWPAMRWQFVTYWTGFGTGTAEGPRAFRLAFALVTAISAAGIARRALRARRAPLSDDAGARGIAFLILAVLAAAAMNLLRIDPVDAAGRIAHIPTARYAYVAIVPAMFLLAFGWEAWWPARRRGLGLAVLVLGILAINLWLLPMVQLPWYTGSSPR